MKKPLFSLLLILTCIIKSEAAQPVKIYALVIGECHYKASSLNKLKYCEDDARAFADFLKSPQAGAIPAENMVFLTGAQATRSAILNAATELFTSRASDNDVVIFYFSGHGVSRAGGGYLMPYEAEDEDPISTGVSMEQLYGIIKTSPAKMKAVYLDACHAGYYPHNSGYKGSPSEMNQEISRAFTTIIGKAQPGTLNVLSSKGYEESQESEALHAGIFTHYLLKGLKGAADKSPSDGRITVAELEEYLSQSVNNESRFRQHPIVSRSLDADFPLSIIDLSLTLSDLLGKQQLQASPLEKPAALVIAPSIKPAMEPLSQGYYYLDGNCYAKATFINNLGFPITMHSLFDDNGNHAVDYYISENEQGATGRLCVKRWVKPEQCADQFLDCVFYFKAQINGETKYAIVRKTIQSCYNQYFVLNPRNVQFTDKQW